MDVIDALLGEHAAAKAVLDALSKDPTNDGLLDIFAELLDSHAKIEEELLYKDKDSRSLPENVSKEMIDEHVEIKALLKASKAAKAPFLRKSRLKALTQKVKHHLHEEEKRVFPQAAGILSDEKRDQLEKRWARFRKVGQ